MADHGRITNKRRLGINSILKRIIRKTLLTMVGLKQVMLAPSMPMDIWKLKTVQDIKSGGEWISSVALESALMAHPKIREAAVIAIADEKWVENLWLHSSRILKIQFQMKN
jgi:hypothetical protein